LFTILLFLLTLFDDYDTSAVCNQLQENDLLHSSHEEDDSIIQSICEDVKRNISLLFSNQEYHTKNGPYEHDINCHSLYHFPTSISNDSCFTSFDLHGSTSHYLDTCREVEPLQPSLMVMSGPHYLGMPPEYDQIHFPSQDSHPDPALLIDNSLFQSFQGFQEDCFKFHDPNVELLE